MSIIELPQLIDPHVHFRVPGMDHKEDWQTGSKAALAGGFTTVLDMPNTKPPTTTSDLLEAKRQIVQKDAMVNYGFHFAASVDNWNEIKKVKDKIASVKVFLNYSTGNLKIEDDKILQKIFKASPIISCHAEGEMVEKAISLTKKCNNKLYLCHISTKDEIDFIKKNKTKNIFVEVTPHHLFLKSENVKDGFWEMYPNLKSQSNVDALWQAIEEGVIDTIGSDHAPHTKKEKRQNDFPRGIPGIETSLPLMLDAVNNGMLKLERLIELMSTNPAKIFRIKTSPDCKTIVDMTLKKEVKNENLYTKCGWSPFDGWQLTGWPIKTIINSQVIFDNNSIKNNFRGEEIYS